MSPKGHYIRKPEQIQKLTEQMTAIGKGRKGKKYASTEPHAQPMEEVKPTSADQTLKVGETNSNNNINKDMVAEEEKEEKTTPEPETPEATPESESDKESDEDTEAESESEPTPEPPVTGRPLTGEEIRQQQEESGKR